MNNKERFATWAIIVLMALVAFATVPGVIHLYKIGEPFLGFCSLLSGVIAELSLYFHLKKLGE